MKNTFWNLVLAASVVCLLAACGASSSKVDTAKLQQAFQSAPAELKSEIDKAVAAIKAGNLAEAATPFKAAAKKGGLTQEQKDAIVAVVTEIQMIASQDPQKFPTEAYRSISEVVPILEGQTPVTGKPPGQ